MTARTRLRCKIRGPPRRVETDPHGHSLVWVTATDRWKDERADAPRPKGARALTPPKTRLDVPDEGVEHA